MADTQEEYLNDTGLNIYNKLIKQYIDEGDADTLKKITSGIENNIVAVGVNGQIKDTNVKIDDIAKKTDIEAIKTSIGDIPNEYNATNIVDYAKELTDKMVVTENYDNRLLTTNYFNEVENFSTLSKYEVSNYEFNNTTNYNLVTLVFSDNAIILDENLMYLVVFKFYNESTNTNYSIDKKISISDLIQENGEIKYIFDATQTGVGDYLSENMNNIDTIKTSYMSASLSVCNIINNKYERQIVLNGFNNYITDSSHIVLNGEDNTVNTCSDVYISGHNNKFEELSTGIVNGNRNEIYNAYNVLTIGSGNYNVYGNYNVAIGYDNFCDDGYCNSIFGLRNRQHYGTYIPRTSWSSCNADTSKTPVKIAIKFSLAHNYTWLRDNLPKVGDMVCLHSYYGIRPSTVLEISMDASYLVTIKINMVDSSEDDNELKWCDNDIHGILIQTYGYNKSIGFIQGEFNSSFANASAILGFGNGVSADYGFAAGRHNQVTGQHSSAFGYGNIASSNCCTVLGCFNEKVSKALLVVGNGANQWGRSNALVLSQTGQLTIAGDLLYENNISLKNKIADLEARLSALENI